MPPATVLDGYACLVLSGVWTGPDPATAGWRAGPLPVPVPPAPGAGPRPEVVADRVTRGAHFSPRVHDALYGAPSEGASTVRWHRATEPAAGPDGATAEAVELLLTPAGALAVVHVQLPADPVAGLAGLTASAGPGRNWLTAILGPDLELHADRARSVTHLAWEGAPPGLPSGLPRLLPQPADEPAPSELDWWAWYLAAGVTPHAFVPDVDGQDWTLGRVRLSRDWSAMVLRDGISFVARTPRTPAGGGADFHASARVYARTLHVDVLLLGILQRTALHRVADSVAALDFAHLDAGGLEELERELLQFRIGLWWNDVGQRGRQTSAVLLAFQEQHRLPDLYDQLVQDLTDLSRYWRAREAADQEAVRHAEERRERRAVNAISVVSFFLLPLTVVYTAAAVITEPSQRLFWWSTGAGAGLCLILLVGAWVWRRATAADDEP
jgi:hypothetical protein